MLTTFHIKQPRNGVVRAVSESDGNFMKYKPEIVSAYYVSEGLPKPVFEYQHIPERRFRLDIAFPQHKVGVEVQGGIWMPVSGHKSGVHLKRDYTKNNLGLLNGWRVLQIEPKDVTMLSTVEMIKKLIALQEVTHA